MYQCIICDPDNRKFEGRCTGLLYTALSRATTLGDNHGKHSAIYFTGEYFNYDRIKYLVLKYNLKEEYENVKRRRTWVEYLARNTRTPPSSFGTSRKDIPKRVAKLFSWFSATKIDGNTLGRLIHKYIRSHNQHSSSRDFHSL